MKQQKDNAMNPRPTLRHKGYLKDWEEKRLGDFGVVEMCRRIFKEQTSSNSEIPFFKIGTFGQKPDAYISRALFNEYRQKYPYPKKGDILISAAGTIGRTVEFRGEEAYYQDSNIVWLNVDEKKIDRVFLNYLYQTIQWGLEGSTIKRLYNSDLLATTFYAPTLTEQQAIGQIFTRVDRILTHAKVKIAKTEALKKALLTALFPQPDTDTPRLRLKGFHGAWQQKRLGEVCDVFRGLTYSLKDICTDGIRVLRSSNIDKDFYVEKNDDVFVNPQVVNIPLVKKGDILITSANSSTHLVGKHAIIKTDTPAVHGGFMLLARTENPYFLNASMSSAWYAKFINRYVAGGNGAIGNLSKSNLCEQEILLPSKEEQTAIGQIFARIDRVLHLQRLRLDKLTQLKKALLERLLV